MTQTIARIKQAGKNFEILVDLNEAMKFKKGEVSSIEAEGDKIFTDSKKGMVASTSNLESSFGTSDLNSVVEKIVKNGEVLLTQDYRDEEKEKKYKQIIDFLSTNAIDPQTKNPHTAERIRRALEESHVNIKNGPIDSQINDIIMEVSKVLPIKLETKKVKIVIPAIHTGKAYGVIAQYKEKETWLDNGDLEVTIAVPSGIVMDFYDKLNSVTHGSAVTEEIKE